MEFTMKYCIGQKIRYEMHGKNWDGDYESVAEIKGFENYYLNNIPVYILDNGIRIAEDKILGKFGVN